MATWLQFKEEVENQMREKSIPSSASMAWIDTGYLYSLSALDVEYDTEADELIITNY